MIKSKKFSDFDKDLKYGQDRENRIVSILDAKKTEFSEHYQTLVNNAAHDQLVYPHSRI